MTDNAIFTLVSLLDSYEKGEITMSDDNIC